MGADQAKQLQNISFPRGVESPSLCSRENAHTPALSLQETELTGLAELRIKEPALG
jgi:hypothetical protein